MNATDSLANHLSTLLTSYTVQQLRWRDTDKTQGQGKLYSDIACFRNPSSGTSDVNNSFQDVEIAIGGDGASLLSHRDKINEIVDYVVENWTASTGEWYEVLSTVSGPVPISNDRHYFETNIRVHFSRG